MATKFTPQRRSLWLSPPLPHSEDSSDAIKFHRYSTMPSTAPFPSSSSGGTMDIEPRSRSNSKSSKDSNGKQRLLYKPSMLNFDSPTKRPELNGKIFGSLRSFKSLRTKASAPLLRASSSKGSTSSAESPTTPTGPTSSTIEWSPFKGLAIDATLSGPRQRRRQRHNSTSASSTCSDDVDASRSAYHELPLAKRAGVRLHSYPRDEVPYMRCYNIIELHNEIYTHLLLRRLNSNGSPSFRKYPVPPRTVLDLGCGQGTWVLEAASAWSEAGTMVTGFDLVDLISDEAKKTPNASWKLGNFVAYKLPFKSETFDLVRLANLTDTVPLSRWEHVLTEVRRVLKPNGRVEIIDDELMFPYLDPSSSPLGSSASSASQTARSSWHSSELTREASEESVAERRPPLRKLSSFLDLDLDHDHEGGSDRGHGTPSLYRGESPSEASSESIRTPTEERSSGWKRQSTASSSKSSTIRRDPLSLCQDLEGIYETMLETRLQVHPRPSEFLVALLINVFGPAGHVEVIEDFRLSLLKPVLHNLVVSTIGMSNENVKRVRKWMKMDRDSEMDREKKIKDQVALSRVQIQNSKAAKLLGLDVDETMPRPSNGADQISTRMSDDSDQSYDAVRPMLSRSPSSLHLFPPSRAANTGASQAPFEPAGLFVFPDRFLETTPQELEMYLCRHVHALLSSKAALTEYVLGLRDDFGEPIVSFREWEDMLVDYECCRRRRFNLPESPLFVDGDEDEPVVDCLAETVKAPRQVAEAVASAVNGLHQTLLGSPYSVPNASTPVRRIRVLEAYKA